MTSRVTETRFSGAWVTTLLLVLGVAGCYPGGAEEYGETDVVLTLRAPDVDLPAGQTFGMPGTVADLGELDEDDPDSTISHAFDPLILSTIKQNLESLGYTYVEDAESADLFVPVGAVIATNWVIYTYYDYWGYWGFYPGYGGGGLWVGYPVQAIGSYRTGTIVFSLVTTESITDIEQEQPSSSSEPSSSDAGQRAAALWAATVNGLAGSSGSVTQQRIQTTINQAFDQSPYLRR